ncbi:MAG: aminotransferase class I/II-fold pyridoxal phosphate-dependent enzyme [Alphaproteobacteria bacterium]|nr:aminotransferase class I/II-fold pyridoxal phosphate-dependent enzyme [Alphaproteobacteria bacterium]
MTDEPHNMTTLMMEARNSGGINLADGRTSSHLTSGQNAIIKDLPLLFDRANTMSQAEVERGFVDTFFAAAKQTCARGYSYFFLTQSASLSTDFAAKLLASRNASVIMVEPFLDYMRDILDRNRVRFEACDEELMFGPNSGEFIRQSSARAVFLCSPNNPTGAQISAENLRQIAEACKATGKLLMMDTTFRLFDRAPYDQYKILLDSGVSFMTVEDTGKAFPTQEMKVSILACSADLYKDLRNIYSEILLRASPVHILLMQRFIEDARMKGFRKTIWKDVGRNRFNLRRVINGTCFEPVNPASTISLEWLKITDPNISAEQITRDLKERGLHVLSGRKFHWSGRRNGDRYFRISLGRQKGVFGAGLRILEEYIGEKGLRRAQLLPQPPSQLDAHHMAIGAMIGTPKEGP